MSRKLLTALLAVGLLSSAAVAADLSAFKVFPNPVHVNRGENSTTFDNGSNPLDGSLKIYTSSGRIVLDASIAPGGTAFVWNLRNNDGNQVASGIYVYKLTVGGDERTGKIGIIR